MRIFALISLLFAFYSNAEEKQFDLGSGLLVKIEEKPFLSSEWEITYCENGTSVCQINGSYPFGAAARIPKTYLSKLAVSFKGKEYALDSSAMFNAWGERPLFYENGIQYFAGVCNHDNWCTLRGLFSDSAGSFVAEWQLRDGVVQRTIITYSDDVVHLFMKNITPPIYD